LSKAEKLQPLAGFFFAILRLAKNLTVLEAVELPAGVADLAASLANVDRDALPLHKNSCQLIT
jgi:hypothetical protein